MAENAKQSDNNFWAIVGKVGAIVIAILGAILTIISIYSFFYPKEEKIDAVGVRSEFRLPEKVEKDLFDYKFISPYEISKIIRDTKPEEKYADYSQAADKILEYVNKIYEPSKKSLDVIKPLESFTEIKVENNGAKQADNVTIEFSGTGYYQIGTSDSDALTPYKESISVGTMRPSTSATIYVWSSYSASSLYDVKVTHANGATKVNFRQDKREEAFSLFSYIPHIFFALLAGFIIFILGVSVGLKEQRKEQNKIKIQEPEQLTEAQPLEETRTSAETPKTKEENSQTA